MKASGYNNNVFLNCPFDSDYKRLFDTMVHLLYMIAVLLPVVLLKKETQVKFESIKFITLLQIAVMEFMIYQGQN